MSSSIDSLSGLAVAAKEVETILALITNVPDRMSRAIFLGLQDQINALQVAAPNHPGVLEARVQWYGFAVDSFETYVVEVAERKEWPFKKYGINFPNELESPNLLAGTDTLGHFLKRHYLKDSFGGFYKRVLGLYRRIGKAPIDVKMRKFFGDLADSLEKCLLIGRL